MRAVVYEVTLYPHGSLVPEVHPMLLMDILKDDLEIPCKPLYVHLEPKVPPMTKFNPEAK